MNQQSFKSNYNERTRLTSVDELAQFLDNVGNAELNFKAIPISGAPEEFHYNGHEQSIIRQKDQKRFDNVEDFIGYAFQCDPEGYSHTEYIDVEVHP